MCGRFVYLLSDEDVGELVDAEDDIGEPSKPNYNVCPTDQIVTVISGPSGRKIVRMRWGFLPHWYKSPTDGPLLINARSETIAEKPAFRRACRETRCLIPASGFYEWTKDDAENRLPWYISPTGNAPLMFAGVWQHWRQGDQSFQTCAIVTTAAGEEMSRIHHREPVTLTSDEFGLWLGEEGRGAATLMKAAPEGRLQAHRVGPAVNSNRAAGPDLIDPLTSSARV